MAVRIAKLREAAGLTRAQLAENLGIAAPSVHEWESGKTKPRVDRLGELAEQLNVSVDTLLGISDGARAA